MQYASVFAAFLASASSAVHIPRQIDGSVWTVTNFLASGAPYSIETTYEFDITDGSIATHCVALESTLPEIGYVPMTNCTNPIYSFAFQSAPSIPEPPTSGYNLQIWEDTCAPECVYTGIYFFPENDVVTVADPSGSGNPNGDYEQLETAPDFTISVTGTHV